jgi:hypothetical protein
VFFHEILRERLRGLKLRGALIRAPYAKALALEYIDDSKRQRIVRTDDGEVDPVAYGKSEQALHVFGGQIQALNAGFGGDTAIARGAPDLGGSR